MNSHGESDHSLHAVIAVAPLPSKFDPVTKDQAYSTNTTIMVRWTDPAGEVEPILGYRLLMTDTVTEVNTTEYDNPTNEDHREKHVTGLVPGRRYEFRILGYNFNGAGEQWSDAVTFRSCTVPVDVPIPTVTEYTTTYFAFAWNPPGYDGGCEVTLYELLVDDKATGNMEVAYTGLPHIREATVFPPTANLGESFRYMLRATNHIGSTTSLVGYALFAQVPLAPVTGPTSDASITNRERIAAVWTGIPVSDNGGSEILGYQLERDDGAGGDFIVLVGEGIDGAEEYLKLSYTAYEGIVEGVTYRYRYRGKNAAGWGPYSPVTHL